MRDRQVLSQQELADLCGLDRAQLSRYEKGRQEPSSARVDRMLDAPV